MTKNYNFKWIFKLRDIHRVILNNIILKIVK